MITYRELRDEVGKAANALSLLGLEVGDRVAIQTPMIPEAVIAVLACARLGVLHTPWSSAASIPPCSSRVSKTLAPGS